MPDRDSQFLEIDAYVRYRIRDPKVFLENLRDEFTAGQRIGSLAISAIRDEVGVRDRRDIIGGDPITQSDGTIIVFPRQTEGSAPSREAMMQIVLQRIKSDIEEGFGVDIVDVRIKPGRLPHRGRGKRIRSDALRAPRFRRSGCVLRERKSTSLSRLTLPGE